MRRRRHCRLLGIDDRADFRRRRRTPLPWLYAKARRHVVGWRVALFVGEDDDDLMPAFFSGYYAPRGALYYRQKARR